jgi:hypothetical protein
MADQHTGAIQSVSEAELKVFLSQQDREQVYTDTFSEWATTERVRAAIFRMLARNQLTQADVILLAVGTVVEIDDLANLDASYDRDRKRRTETLSSKVMAEVRDAFDRDGSALLAEAMQDAYECRREVA